MEHAGTVIIIAVAAFALPLVAGRMGPPAVVLEILFGILVGPSLLGLIHGSAGMDYLAELGFLLLMFLSGFEIDFRRLERQGSSQILVGMLVFVLTMAAALQASRLLGLGPFVTLVLATTSVGIVVPTLRSARCTSTPLGQAILIAALLTDFLTLILATLFAMVRGQGIGWHLLNFPLLFLSFVMLLVALRRLAWWYPERFERLFDPEDPEEMGIRTCLFLMFVFVGISHLLDVEAILGAFLAGTCFGFVFRHRGQLERKMKGFSYGFLIPIFFIHVGVRFDVQSLMRPGVLGGALALLAAAAIVKIVAASALLLRGFSPRQVLAAGFLLSARLSLVIAVAEMGVRLGLLNRALEAQVVLLAVVSSIAAPTLFRAVMPPVEEPSAETEALVEEQA